ncbi:MAG TPA: sigma-70 family RNA polymerase sigma factor [Candidatus Eisenbacteria bacterium]|jgi:RNA polymerase sigma-70 factor (ECF subfamily)|nr:sigma-70 family RNA polymerase sigma factor [Candidatus Eisenbacteria bacterium]
MGTEPRIEDRRVVSLSDEDLMAEAAEGSERAFSELVSRYRSRVLNLVSRLLNDRESSDDISQEVFVRVYLHRKNYRRGAKFSTWLFTIAANLAKNEIRRRKRRRNWSSLDELQEQLHDSSLQLMDPKGNREAEVDSAQIQGIVGEAITTLPERYRLALVLRDVEGLAYEEIAQVLGIPGGTVRSRINRARLMLKKKLEPMLRREELT